MTIVGFSIFIINGFLAVFTLNVVVKQKKKEFTIQCIVFFLTAILGIYYFAEEYLIEAVFSLVILGIPSAFLDNILPKFIKNNTSIIKMLGFVSVISLFLIIFL